MAAIVHEVHEQINNADFEIYSVVYFQGKDYMKISETAWEVVYDVSSNGCDQQSDVEGGMELIKRGRGRPRKPRIKRTF